MITTWYIEFGELLQARISRPAWVIKQDLVSKINTFKRALRSREGVVKLLMPNAEKCFFSEGRW